MFVTPQGKRQVQARGYESQVFNPILYRRSQSLESRSMFK